jgi:hypothetical protein
MWSARSVRGGFGLMACRAGCVHKEDGMRLTHAAFAVSLAFLPRIAVRAVPGDLDADGSITARDAIIAARLAAQTPPSESPLWFAADVAGPAGNVRDDRVDWHDVARLIRAAGGLDEIPDAPVDVLGDIRMTLDVPTNQTTDFQIPTVPGSPTNTFPVRGRVTNLPAGVVDPSLFFYQFLVSGGVSLTGVPIGADGTYAAQLPPADYHLYFGGVVEESVSGGTYRWEFRADLNRDVSVAGPAKVDAVAPSPPLPGELTGALATSNIIPSLVNGLSHPEPFRGFPDVTKSLLTSQGVVGPSSYRLKAIPTTQRVTFRAGFTGNPDLFYTLTLSPNPELTAGQTVSRDVAIPAAVPVSLNIQPPAGTNIAGASLAMALSGGAMTLTTTPKMTDATTLASALPPGDASVDISIHPTAPSKEDPAYSTRRTLTVPPSGGSLPIALPNLPALVALNGTVTYPNGAPAAGVVVAVTTAPSRLAGASEYGFSARTPTDAQGRYEIHLPADRYIVQVPAIP